MARGEGIHVVPNGSEWAVTHGGGTGPEQTFPTQAEAERAGREMARAEHTEFILHGQDGKIRERDSYGNDPRRTKG